MINHNIIPFDRDDLRQREAFLELLTDYFAGLRFDDPGDAVPPDAVPKILEMICDMLDKGGYWVFFCLHAGEYAGFIIAQIDAPDKDWCKRPGWGFIREIYVAPGFRGHGLARQMAALAEETISSAGAEKVYLTTDEPDFWAKMGYTPSGETDEGNGGEIFTKKIGG